MGEAVWTQCVVCPVSSAHVLSRGGGGDAERDAGATTAAAMFGAVLLALAAAREKKLLLTKAGGADSPFYLEYELGAAIGKGGFAEVHCARERLSGAAVAVKIVQKAGLDARDVDAFRAECDHLRRLKHPNVLRFIKLIEDERRFFLVTEIAEGGDLFGRLVEMHAREHARRGAIARGEAAEGDGGDVASLQTPLREGAPGSERAAGGGDGARAHAHPRLVRARSSSWSELSPLALTR